MLVALPLSGCGGSPDRRQAPLAGAAIGGPFALTDQDGRPVTDKDFAGRYRAIYFGYSFCPDVCPTTLQGLMQGYHAFAKDKPAQAAKIVPIFISVDPDRDTPAVLKTYVAAFGPELKGLTGTPAEIARVTREYAVSYGKQPVARGTDASHYLMSHSNVVILFGPEGRPITMVPTDQGAQAVSDIFATWVR
ncbi:SCO family protein [Sphingomonas abietis]|uniref:SCO family protein n=1 Tax=Sphingomonas abietis TaxID=3012344 RepID=A0ABY7NM44_9SPHN|nr:SCO family protein [Sphingomonas abietis]WBO22599.1 SCO family protein [Sphingomonas abietis]